MNTTSHSTGLFGYSNGTTIKNVVIDDSCSITNHLNGGSTCIGSFVAWCRSFNSPCTVEGIVNMADVTFNGNLSGDLHIGGIAGVISSSSEHALSVKNCVNYGTITQDGVTGGYCDIGGILGHTYGETNYIQNCINYGTIRYTGSTTNLRGTGGIGGILGYLTYSSLSGNLEETIIENCLSAGRVEANGTNINWVGSILGYANSSGEANITHCFWTSETGYSNAFGKNDSAVIATDSSIAELNAETLKELNEYAKQYVLGESYILHLNGGRINGLVQDIMVMSQKHFPDPAKDGNSFLFWCEDKDCVAVYDPAKGTSATEFYAAWSINTVTFVFGNGTVAKKDLTFNDPIPYPNDAGMTKEGHTFSGWNPRPGKVSGHDITVTAQWSINKYKVSFDLGNGTVIEDSLEYGKGIVYPDENEMAHEGYRFSGWDKDDETVPAHDLTITAQWKANEYKVTFDFNGGDELSVKEITVTFGNTYGTLPTPTKTGYTFLWWFNEKNEEITRETVVKIPKNHTLIAQWKENPTNQVEIVFGTKDLTEKGIKEIIKKYTDEGDYTIIKIDDEGSDEIRVIIRFKDIERAESFIETIKTSSEAANGLIKGVVYSDYLPSPSTMSNPSFFMVVLLSVIYICLL